MPAVTLETVVMISTVGRLEAIVNVRADVAAELAFVAVNVTVNVPDTNGVPEIKPVVVLILSSGGNPAAVKLTAMLVAVI